MVSFRPTGRTPSVDSDDGRRDGSLRPSHLIPLQREWYQNDPIPYRTSAATMPTFSSVQLTVAATLLSG